jgi:hypothetical protein
MRPIFLINTKLNKQHAGKPLLPKQSLNKASLLVTERIKAHTNIPRIFYLFRLYGPIVCVSVAYLFLTGFIPTSRH